MRLGVAVAALLAAVVWVGCGEDDAPPAKPIAVPASWGASNAGPSNQRRVGGPIEAASAGRLRVAWTLPLGNCVATPVVVGGVLYIQDRESNVLAIELDSGRTLWERIYDSRSGGPNGVTVAGGRVYGGTATSVFALDATTGRQLWVRRIVRNDGEGVNMAPGHEDGTIFISTSSLNVDSSYKADARGVLWAIDGATGRTRWRWNEVPPALWGDRKVNSGGGMWHAPAFDGSGFLYASVANPGPVLGTPEFDPRSRPGSNKWSNSVVKLDAATGEMAWGCQVLAHDVHNWDLSAPPVLARVGSRGVVAAAGKMGYVDAFERDSGERLWTTAVGRHNGHDDDGLRIMRGRFKSLRFPMRVMPGQLAGVSTPLAVDADTVYAPTNNLYIYYFTEMAADWQPFEEGTSEMVALDLASGGVKWVRRFEQPMYGAASVVNDLVFTTTYEGMIWAMRTDTGEIAWRSRLPAGTERAARDLRGHGDSERRGRAREGSADAAGRLQA